MSNEAGSDEEARKAYEARLKQAQLDMKKKELLRRILSDRAYERMMNVRMSSPEVYEKALSSLAYFAQQNGLKEKVTDEQLYALLQKMTAEPETKIEFKRK